MKAIQFTQTGGPDVLTLIDQPTPSPKAGDVLVRHTAIGINYIDTDATRPKLMQFYER